MDFSSVCRTCLNSKSLNPIFKSDDFDAYSDAIHIATGIQVKFNDDLPQQMCNTCIIRLNNTLKFRKQCKEVEIALLKIKTELELAETAFMTPKEDTTSKTKYIIEEASINKQVLSIDVLKIKTSLNNKKFKTDVHGLGIKLEPIDNDDQPLKFLIHSKSPSTIDLIQNNLNNTETLLNVKSTEESIDDTGFLDEEIDLYDHKDDLKTEDQVLENAEMICGEAISDADSMECLIYSHEPLKKNTKRIKHNDKTIDDGVKKTTETIEKPKTIDFCEDEEVPYQVIIDSVTNKKRAVCKLCQKELSMRSIDSHMACKHPGADERKVKCEFCDKYILKAKLNRHKILTHSSEGFKCKYCKTEFDGKDLLMEHIASCTAKKRKRKVNDSGRELSECDVCHKTMQRASLKMHKAVKHAGLRPVCEHCGKSFGNKFRLNEHCRAKHGYEKFQCNYCDFRSAGIMAMRNHERRHRGEKPFICETCGAKFHAAYLLAQHKHSHRTDKLFKCDLCPASFKSNNSLHMHKLTCHSKTVYRCTLCSRSYKCRYYAVKHVRHAHSHTGAPPVVKLMTQ